MGAGSEVGGGIIAEVMLGGKVRFILMIELEYFPRIRTRADEDKPATGTTTPLETVFLNDDIIRIAVTEYTRNGFH